MGVMCLFLELGQALGLLSPLKYSGNDAFLVSVLRPYETDSFSLLSPRSLPPET